MNFNKILSIFLSLVMLITSLTTTVFVYAKTSTEDGVVIVEDASAKTTRYIYYPEALKTNSKKYPVIIWANGTGCRQSTYVDLFKGFVKNGYIVVASSDTMAASGNDQIASLDYIINKSKKSSEVLYNRVQTDKITAMGHSQGGRSAVNAAVADHRFCCVVSIAGSNYQEEVENLKAPALFLTGTKDIMVPSSDWVKPAYDICKGAAVYASLVGASHTACSSSPEKYIDYCISWIKAWTNDDNNALAVFKSGGKLSKDSDWCDVVGKNLTNNISGSVILSANELVYNGKMRKPSVVVKNYRGAKISSSNYSVSYDKGCKNVGKYKVTVKYKNNYSGKKTLYFTIVPKATSITKISASSGGFKVSWSKQTSQTTGYQIQYSTSSKFSKPKYVTVSGNAATSAAVTKLTKSKKYYVRIRTYKEVKKVKYYSSWSSPKSVTTLK